MKNKFLNFRVSIGLCGVVGIIILSFLGFKFHRDSEGIFSEGASSGVTSREQILSDSSFEKKRIVDGMDMIFISDTVLDHVTEHMQDGDNINGEVDGFWIDKYEVTNQQYKACVDKGICTEPISTSSHTRNDYYGNVEFNNFPVIFVNWDQSRMYCEFIGGRLPTIEEWEAAVGCNFDGNIYPWGNSLPGDALANYLSEDTSEVGSYLLGASPYGALDMAGNVWEWIDSKTGKKPNCCGLSPDDQYQILKGGSWNVDQPSLENSYQITEHFLSARNDTGFRCVMDGFQ